MKSIVIPQGQDSVVRISTKKRSTVALPSSMTIWGKITGDLDDQTDLKEQLDELRILAYAGL